MGVGYHMGGDWALGIVVRLRLVVRVRLWVDD
jgi:hypothetical protein